jgi:hypothetical protein
MFGRHSGKKPWTLRPIPLRPKPTVNQRNGSDGMGTPEEAGRLCLFIAAEATFTTGVDHLLTGGAELGYGRKPLT